MSKAVEGQSSLFERWFKLTENNTSVKTEVIAGITTFLTMVYIIFVNPSILADAGMNWNGVFIATVLASIVGTLVMAFSSNYPFALAPGMGLNAFFAYVIASQVGWQVALGIVFLEGILFIILSATSFRAALVNSIPMTLKASISAGIGLFIALIGFKNAEIIVPYEATLVSLGDLTAPGPLTAIFGLFVVGILYSLKVKGSILWGILAATVFGMLPGIGVTGQYSGLLAWPAWGDFASVAFQLDVAGALSLGLIGIILSLLIVDLFDTAGTLVGVATQAGYLDKEGNLPRANKALMSDAVATTTGALFGTSTTTTYVESAAGVSAGGRTGLTGLVVASLFFLSLFFMPLVGMVPAAATAPALIIVGILMMKSVTKIDWEDFTQAFPAFLTIVGMPFTFSIADGIAFGFVSYALLNNIVSNKNKATWIVNLVALIFVLFFIFLK